MIAAPVVDSVDSTMCGSDGPSSVIWTPLCLGPSVFRAGVLRLHGALGWEDLWELPESAPRFARSAMIHRLLKNVVDLQSCTTTEMTAAQSDLRLLTASQLVALRCRAFDTSVDAEGHHRSFIDTLDSQLFEKVVRQWWRPGSRSLPPSTPQLLRALGRAVTLVLGLSQLGGTVDGERWSLPELWVLSVPDARSSSQHTALLHTTGEWVDVPEASGLDFVKEAHGRQVGIVRDRGHEFDWDTAIVDPNLVDVLVEVSKARVFGQTLSPRQAMSVQPTEATENTVPPTSQSEQTSISPVPQEPVIHHLPQHECGISWAGDEQHESSEPVYLYAFGKYFPCETARWSAPVPIDSPGVAPSSSVCVQRRFSEYSLAGTTGFVHIAVSVGTQTDFSDARCLCGAAPSHCSRANSSSERWERHALTSCCMPMVQAFVHCQETLPSLWTGVGRVMAFVRQHRTFADFFKSACAASRLDQGPYTPSFGRKNSDQSPPELTTSAALMAQLGLGQCPGEPAGPCPGARPPHTLWIEQGASCAGVQFTGKTSYDVFGLDDASERETNVHDVSVCTADLYSAVTERGEKVRTRVDGIRLPKGREHTCGTASLSMTSTFHTQASPRLAYVPVKGLRNADIETAALNVTSGVPVEVFWIGNDESGPLERGRSDTDPPFEGYWDREPAEAVVPNLGFIERCRGAARGLEAVFSGGPAAGPVTEPLSHVPLLQLSAV